MLIHNFTLPNLIMDKPYIDWMYFADHVIYIFGYVFIIYLTYRFSYYFVEYSRTKKTGPPAFKEKVVVYLTAFLIALSFAFLFCLKSAHRVEKYLIAFLSLILPACIGLIYGYKREEKLTRDQRLSRKELLGKKNDNRDI